MLIENNSRYLLKKTRAKAKMLEYRIPSELHIDVEDSVPELLLIAIGAIGNISADILRSKSIEVLSKSESKSDLEFSSKFFDSFLNSKIDDSSEDYYLLLGSVAYYLCDFIGSSKVLVNQINIFSLNLGVNSIDVLLANILKDKYNIDNINLMDNPYSEIIQELLGLLMEFDLYKKIENFEIVDRFRSAVYETGTPLELLLTDALLAILIIKINFSPMKLLPKYSSIESNLWEKAIIEGDLIKELWPSQRKLGEMGVYSGTSAVIQMPMGSGKTKAISLIVYSAFIAERTNFSVIVAPFRALCREISYDLENDFRFDSNIKVDQLSDILIVDELSLDAENDSVKTILVVTPEKLLYLIRQKLDIVKMIGLIIFDEAHLFDDLHRGATYELLVSTIRGYIDEDAQKVLVSAVMSNANQLNRWINGDSGIEVCDNTIKSTEKQIAITDWRLIRNSRYGYLYFLNSTNLEEEEFYVPRLIHINEISKLNGERKSRYFPEVDSKTGKVEHNDIAIYYGIHLCENGAVAVFCGKKETANNILKRILKLELRKYNITSLIRSSNSEEIARLVKLIGENYGDDNIYYEAAKRAVFVHHSGISNGIRISIEFAMRKRLINFLICTSTLAQGVNLPIRYLVVSSIYQGRDRISVRDFHNLIGRAGRSGIYTEGSILLTETSVYNSRYRYKNWKWKNYKNVIDASNSEACTSTLLDMVRDVKLSWNSTFNFRELIQMYYEEYERYLEKTSVLSNKLGEDSDRFINKLQYVITVLNSVESFLLSYLMDDTYEDFNEIIDIVLRNTFAYYLADEKEKEDMVEIFGIICRYIVNNTDSAHKRYIYSKSLQGIKNNIRVENWVAVNFESLQQCEDTNEIFILISPLIYELTESKVLKKIQKLEAFIEIGQNWINGKSYYDITKKSIEKGFEIEKRKRIQTIELDDVIEICDNGFGYSVTLVLTAISEVYSDFPESEEKVLALFKQLSSQLRYGLNNNISIAIYEIGFSDRVVAKEIAKLINIDQSNNLKRRVKYLLKQNREIVEGVLTNYPSVFEERLRTL